MKYNLVKGLENKKTIIDKSKITCNILNNFIPVFNSSFAIYAKATPQPKPVKLNNIVKRYIKTICYAPNLLLSQPLNFFPVVYHKPQN